LIEIEEKFQRIGFGCHAVCLSDGCI
jgi:hypothetical protein